MPELVIEWTQLTASAAAQVAGQAHQATSTAATIMQSAFKIAREFVFSASLILPTAPDVTAITAKCEPPPALLASDPGAAEKALWLAQLITRIDCVTRDPATMDDYVTFMESYSENQLSFGVAGIEVIDRRLTGYQEFLPWASEGLSSNIEMEDKSLVIRADTASVLTREERALALDVVSQPTSKVSTPLPFNPDDYPLF